MRDNEGVKAVSLRTVTSQHLLKRPQPRLCVHSAVYCSGLRLRALADAGEVMFTYKGMVLMSSPLCFSKQNPKSEIGNVYI